jgi:integrase
MGTHDQGQPRLPIRQAVGRHRERYNRRPSDGDWLLPSPEGRHWEAHNFRHDLAALNKAAGLPWTALDFRHIFGSQLAMKGDSLYKISALMGNSPEICRRHYAALIPEAMADTFEFATPVRKPQTVPALRLVGA